MLDRIQPSADDANIVVDPHTPGKNATVAAGKTLRATEQNLSFALDYTQGQVGRGSGLAIPSQVEITERSKGEFVVKVTVRTDDVCDMCLARFLIDTNRELR